MLYQMILYLVLKYWLYDKYVCMWTVTKSSGYKYWEYVIIHTDNLLIIFHHDALVMKGFDQYYTLKKDTKTGKK